MSRPSHLKPDYSEFVEVDPTRRYVRYNEVLGRGASKTVYKAFDEHAGIEVAWNQVNLYDYYHQSSESLEMLYSEIHLLKTLNHKNLIKFHNSWIDPANSNINFVTEMFNSSLRQYRLKHRRVSVRTVKHWCRQILSGLVYLHSHDPLLIHRDLKCDNILINGNNGTVKIGDLGLGAILREESHVADFVGTPEFMAPEVYEGEYNELADIYSFGMCILEMVTSEYPYGECADNAEIYKKVISGEKPDALYKVKDEEIKEFVEKCLAPVSLRLSAMELLNDHFLQIDDSNSEPLVHSRDLIGRQPHFDLLDNSNSYVNGHSKGDIHEAQNEQEHCRIEIESSGNGNFEMSIKGKRRDGSAIFLSLRVADKKGRVQKIYFPFDIKSDTALIVATEMVAEVDSIDRDLTIIADMIDAEISSLVPEWRAGQAKYSKRQFEQLENKNNETYDDAEPKPSQWNAMARRKPQDSVTNNPLGCRPSVRSGLDIERASKHALSYLGIKPTIYHGGPLEAPTTTLHPVSAREPVSEQAASDSQTIHLGVPSMATTPTSQAVAPRALIRTRHFRR